MTEEERKEYEKERAALAELVKQMTGKDLDE